MPFSIPNDDELEAMRLSANLGISFSEAIQLLRDQKGLNEPLRHKDLTNIKIEKYAECPMTGTLEKLP